MKISIKQVFQGSWIITKVYQGLGKKVRIDARRRFPIADESSFFSKWCSKEYADKLSKDQYGKAIQDLNVWVYL